MSHACSSPTLPQVQELNLRSELLAVLEVVEGVAAGSFDRDALIRWIDVHIVAAGRGDRPPLVLERGVGAVALDRPGAIGAHARRVAETARSRLVAAARAFISARHDDTFVTAAIYAGRVRRVRVGDRRQWVARPLLGDSLSEMLLALLVADLLPRRELYEATLCVCDECGRLSFGYDRSARHGCFEHTAASPDVPSGVRRRTTVPPR